MGINSIVDLVDYGQDWSLLSVDFNNWYLNWGGGIYSVNWVYLIVEVLYCVMYYFIYVFLYIVYFLLIEFC